MQNTYFYKTKCRNSLIFNVKLSLFVSLSLTVFLSCKNEIGDGGIDKTGVVKLFMQEQEDAWNEGDLEGFMKHYWNSDSLRFIGKSGLNYGWQNTLDNYKKSYKNKEEMGKLKFNNKSLDIIGEQAIFVIGEWKLTRGGDLEDLSGMYSLIWQHKNGEWVITTDHSS